MLKTKEDIKAQKAKDGGGQLDLVVTIKNQKKEIKSQKFVTYSLFITLSLSCLLWAFTDIKKDIQQGKKFSINIPKFTPSVVKNTPSSLISATSLENIITNYINDDGIWSFYISTTQFQDSNILYQRNVNDFSQTPDLIRDNLGALGQSTIKTFSSSLPQGLSVIENLIEGRQSFQSELLITLPSQVQILIISKNSGSLDMDNSKDILNSLIPQIYWDIIQSN